MEMTKELRDTIVTELYQRCAKGEISCNQRETLIRKTNSMFTVNESVQTSKPETIVSNNQKEISSKEKYNLFKESVYKKYANKKITLEQREILLEKAKNEFMEISE